MADTFGTFLDTMHRLEAGKREKQERGQLQATIRELMEQALQAKARVQERSSQKWADFSTPDNAAMQNYAPRFEPADASPQSEIIREVFFISRLLAAGGTAMPVKAVMAKSGLSQESFFGALLAGRDKGIFQIDEEGAEPVVNMTKLGTALVG